MTVYEHEVGLGELIELYEALRIVPAGEHVLVDPFHRSLSAVDDNWTKCKLCE
jgi:hypothetical protein